MTQFSATNRFNQFKTQAKTLLKQARAGESQALERFMPYFPVTIESPPKLFQAQLVIAREQGYQSWAALKAALAAAPGEAMRDSNNCVATIALTPSAQAPTLAQNKRLSIRLQSFNIKSTILKLLKVKAVTAGVLTSRESTTQLRCSFCGKNAQEIQKLIAGPGIHICNECVGLCNKILNQENR